MAGKAHTLVLLIALALIVAFAPGASAASGDGAYRPGATETNPTITWGVQDRPARMKPNPRINWGVQNRPARMKPNPKIHWSLAPQGASGPDSTNSGDRPRSPNRRRHERRPHGAARVFPADPQP